MNTKHLLAAAILAVAGTSAFAGGEFDPLRDYQQPTVESKLTRAEVKAQVKAAFADGSINRQGDLYGYATTPKAESSVTRAEVREEARTAVRTPQRGRGYGFSGS